MWQGLKFVQRREWRDTDSSPGTRYLLLFALHPPPGLPGGLPEGAVHLRQALFGAVRAGPFHGAACALSAARLLRPPASLHSRAASSDDGRK